MGCPGDTGFSLDPFIAFLLFSEKKRKELLCNACCVLAAVVVCLPAAKDLMLIENSEKKCVWVMTNYVEPFKPAFNVAILCCNSSVIVLYTVMFPGKGPDVGKV